MPLRVDVLLEHLTGPERDHSSRRNANLFSGPGVSAFSCALAPDNKISEPRDLDRFTLLQHCLEHVQHEFDDIGRFILGDPNLLVDFIRDICLSHAFPLG